MLKDSELLSTTIQQNVACDGESGSSVVFTARTARKRSDLGCNNDPSDPFSLKTACGHNQAHQAVELAFRDRSSFTLGFRVLCEGNQCGSELVLRAREFGCCVGYSVSVTMWRLLVQENPFVQGF